MGTADGAAKARATREQRSIERAKAQLLADGFQQPAPPVTVTPSVDASIDDEASTDGINDSESTDGGVMAVIPAVPSNQLVSGLVPQAAEVIGRLLERRDKGTLPLRVNAALDILKLASRPAVAPAGRAAEPENDTLLAKLAQALTLRRGADLAQDAEVIRVEPVATVQQPSNTSPEK